MMDQEKDLLGQMFSMCRCDSVMVPALGNDTLTLLSFLKTNHFRIQLSLDCSLESSLSILYHRDHFIVSTV